MAGNVTAIGRGWRGATVTAWDAWRAVVGLQADAEGVLGRSFRLAGPIGWRSIGGLVTRATPPTVWIHELSMLFCMQSTSVRIDSATHDELKRLAAELNTTVGNTVSLAVRALRQDRLGADLSAPLRDDEVEWLDADLG